MKTKIRTEITALWQLAWPVLVGQLATVGMAVADVAMTGHLSTNDLAAVALGSSLWTIVLFTLVGIMLAVNAFVAHEVGANAFSKIPHIMRQAMWLGFGLGLLACFALNASVVVLDHLDITPLVRHKASQFVHIISFGLPAFGCYRALYGYTASLNQTKPVMLIAILGLLFNIVVNWLLIFGHWGFPQMGASGCAVATALGLWLMLAAMLWWVRRAPHYRSSDPFTHWEWPHYPEIMRMLRLGVPIGVTYFAEVSAFSLVGLLVARFGVVTLSAHQITLNFTSLVFMVPMSLGIALTTRAGQALGEGDPHRARFVSWVGVGLALVVAVISASLIMLLREPIAAMYSAERNVQLLTMQLLLLAAVFQLSDAAQIMAASAIRAYKVTRSPMLIHLVAFWGVSLPIGCVLGLAPDWLPFGPQQAMGSRGFWLGLVFGLSFAGCLLVILLQRLSLREIARSEKAGAH